MDKGTMIQKRFEDSDHCVQSWKEIGWWATLWSELDQEYENHFGKKLLSGSFLQVKRRVFRAMNGESRAEKSIDVPVVRMTLITDFILILSLCSTMLLPIEIDPIKVSRENSGESSNNLDDSILKSFKKRGQAADRNLAIQEEVGKLVEAGIMREVHYHDWLSNPVMIDRNLEVYVDDLVIKSRMEDEIIRDIEETFKTLREINMKLNPKKCAFGVEEGMFIGYKVNAKGLKVCPDKVDVVLSLPSLKCLKDMQKLNGKLTSLNRFLAKSAEKSLPFFKTLKKCTKKSDFRWTKEAEEAFNGKGDNFIVERPEYNSSDTPMEMEEELPEPWILFTDRSSCTDGSGAGLILTNPEGMEFTYALRFRFDATNNEAEYEALIAGLRIAEQMGVKNLQADVDSCLVANQVNGTYVAKEADMIRYLEKVKALTGSFKAFSIKQIPRSENKKVDALRKIASTSFMHLSKKVLVKELKEKSISEVEILAVVEEEGDTWMTPLFEYLAEGTLPTKV
ncbi:reverse transcriptase domain-containing protein [Tanacetum coccineum]